MYIELINNVKVYLLIIYQFNIHVNSLQNLRYCLSIHEKLDEVACRINILSCSRHTNRCQSCLRYHWYKYYHSVHTVIIAVSLLWHCMHTILWQMYLLVWANSHVWHTQECLHVKQPIIKLLCYKPQLMGASHEYLISHLSHLKKLTSSYLRMAFCHSPHLSHLTW